MSELIDFVTRSKKRLICEKSGEDFEDFKWMTPGTLALDTCFDHEEIVMISSEPQLDQGAYVVDLAGSESGQFCCLLKPLSEEAMQRVFGILEAAGRGK